jgi:hypothetical protein
MVIKNKRGVRTVDISSIEAFDCLGNRYKQQLTPFYLVHPYKHMHIAMPMNRYNKERYVSVSLSIIRLP